MITNGLVLMCVLAVLCRSQTVVKNAKTVRLLRSTGTFLALLLPMCALLAGAGFDVSWQNSVYVIGFSLSVLLLVVFEDDWERRWPLLLVWPVFPLMSSNSALGLWISLILTEFLLFFAHQDEDKRSDYYKYALLRLLVVFQFFVFESLFFHQRTALSSEVFSALILGLYVIALVRVVMRIVVRRPVTWLFLLAYLQFGIVLVDRLGIQAKFVS